MKKFKKVNLCITAGAMAFLLCVLAVMPVSAFTMYEGVPGTPLMLPYPEFYGALTVSSVDITMDIHEFAQDRMDAESFFAYEATATADITFYNTGKRTQNITMRWDIGQLPYYLISVAREEYLIDFLAMHTVQVDGEQVTPDVHMRDDGQWVAYVTYPLTVEPGDYVTTSVKCPVYPSILDQYDPAIYSYDIAFGELRSMDSLEIQVNTPYKIAKGMIGSGDFDSAKDFDKVKGGYYLRDDDDPRSYYTIDLSTRTRQFNGDELFWNALPFVLLAIPVLFVLGVVAVVVLVIVVIVMTVRRGKRRNA